MAFIIKSLDDCKIKLTASVTDVQVNITSRLNAAASSGLLIQDPTRNLGLIVSMTFFSFSTAKWTSFAMKFISALSLVLVLFPPRALWESWAAHRVP